MSGELESYLRGLDLNTPKAQELINWSCKLTLCQRERDGGGGQPPVKSEVRAQSNKVGRLWFFGGKCSRISGGTPEARSRICVCQASFLMTFARGGARSPHISTPRRESGSLCLYVGCVDSHTVVSPREPRMFLRDEVH